MTESASSLSSKLGEITHQILLTRLAGSHSFRYISGILNSVPLPKSLRGVHIGQLYFRAHSLDRLCALYLYKFQLLETNQLKYLATLVQPGMCIYDLGANIGFHTVALGRELQSKGVVYAFEPEPQNYAQLSENIKLNSLTEVIQCIPQAISDRKGKAELHICREHKGNHTLIPRSQSHQYVSVHTQTIDTFCQTHRTPDLIHMDIEGFEFHALRGAKKLLFSKRPLTIVSEFAPYLLRDAGSDPEEYLNYVQNKGFTLKRFHTHTYLPTATTISECLDACRDNSYISVVFQRK